MKSACLGQSEKTQVLARSVLIEKSGYLSLDGELSEGALCHVIFPGYSVRLQEDEETVPVSLKALVKLIGRLRLILPAVNVPLVKPFHVTPKLSQMSRLQPVSVHCLHYRDNQIPDFDYESLKFPIKRILPEIVIYISTLLSG